MSLIERAKPADGQAVLQITHLAGNFSQKDIACVEELWGAYTTKGAKDTGYDFIVFRDGDHILGFACFGPTPLTEGTYSLYWLAVHPQSRRQGVGRALITWVEEEIRRQGGRLLLVETSGTAAYEGTRRFYESCGYCTQAIIHDFYALGDDLFVFGKVLRSPS